MKVVMFEAESWCTSCKQMKPFFIKECEKLNVPYEIIDVESEKGIEMSLYYKIRNVPTLLFLDENENEVGRESGNQAYKKIKEYYD